MSEINRTKARHALLEWLALNVGSRQANECWALIEAVIQADAEDLNETIDHLKANWQALIDAPDLAPETVAQTWLEGEQRYNQTIPWHPETKLSGMRVRLASVIARARVDGGIAARHEGRLSRG